ncbi:MAG: alpha-1,2-fucosyltransferase [Bacteroides sp.]|nr:alpha-1,2-fucosyltransferase [Bacteroides sp.]MCI1682245.1 alpha-1,2-fucosyltransferase [Bacteroides sp.]
MITRSILKYKIYRFFLKNKIIPSKVILLMDGGICSQMHQFLLGQLYAQKGYQVRYDLGFYREWGSDLNRKFVRNFDLLKAFPYLTFKEASPIALQVYRKKYYISGNNSGKRIDDFSFLQRKPPLYLGGYYHLQPDVWLKAFRALFYVDLKILDGRNERICNEIKSRNSSVAVHVRYGDLKNVVYAYGQPASSDYFIKAVRYFYDKVKTPYFYFFSDEPDKVLLDLIPLLPLNHNFKIADGNGSDRGYMDLFLIACCKHQITSKGTLGKYGAVLMDNANKIVTLCDDDTEYPWKELLKNPVFL